MSRLPEIYKNSINKKINNNQEMDIVSSNLYNNLYILDEVFKKGTYPFSKDLIIKTKNKVYDTNLINRNNNCVRTIDGDIINIEDIIDIQIKKS